MKFPLSWISDYVDLTGVTPVELADRLNRSGFEVEEIISVGPDLCNVVTARIESIDKHPNADRLQITQVFDGTTHHQIVTGAQNISVGDIVPVSLPGAILAGGLKIKPSQLRGIPSNGMLCSETELGVAESASGIWILEPDTPLGLDFVSYAILQDTVLDVAILPNRGDSQSILGLAREISVILDRPLTLPPRGYTVTPVALDCSITVTAPDLCPVYLIRGITQVKNGIAPLHLRRRLALAGLRSIDRIVDITNYVMLETGQPLHAFDRAALVGMHLTVDNARNGEIVQTLDNEVRELTEQIPVIRDGQGVVALAGVMGAQRGSVGAETSDLLIEAAYFAPTRIRKSKGILGLRTESAIRFEKGVDPDAVAFAQDRALYLLETLAEGKVVGGPIEYRDATHPIVVRGTLPLNPEKINRLLGTSYTETDMKSVLNRLGFESVGDEVVIPSWRRHDIKDWPCLAEEVARILGYDPIPEILDFRMVPQEKPSRLAELSATTETFWINQGFQQIQTFTMVAPEDFKATKVPMPSDWLQIQNPLTQSESVLRRFLMPSMLRAVSHNLKHQNGDLQFFEIGKVFYLAQEGEIREHLVCGAICTGSGWIFPYSDKDKAVSEPSFFRMKGWAEELLGQLQISGATVNPSTYPQYHPFMSVDIKIDTKVVGNVGFLHPEILENYDIRQPVGYVGLNLSALATLEVSLPSFKSFGRFPHTRRDVALLAPRHVGYADIIAAIDAHLPPDVSQYFLFDHFESDKLGVDKKSLAFGFIYSHMDKTLSDDDVNAAHEAFCQKLTESLPISIR